MLFFGEQIFAAIGKGAAALGNLAREAAIALKETRFGAKIFELLEKVPGLARILKAVTASKMLRELQLLVKDEALLKSLLEAAGHDEERLRALLRMAQDNPAKLQGFIHELGNAQRVEELVKQLGTGQRLEELLNACGGSGSKLEQLIKTCKGVKNVDELVRRCGSVSKVEELMAKAGGDPERLLNLLEKNGNDLQKVEQALAPVDKGLANLRGPANRHWITKVKQNTYAQELNSVFEPGVDVAKDVEAIRAGKATTVGDQFVVNGRTYGMHEGTLYPISGPGIHQLDRGAFKALGVYNTFGDTPRAAEILDKMGMGEAQRKAALDAWKAAQAAGVP